jgi:hypothetical protein
MRALVANAKHGAKASGKWQGATVLPPKGQEAPNMDARPQRDALPFK